MTDKDKKILPKKKPFRWQTRDSLVVVVIILFIASWFYGKQNFKAHIDPFFEKAWTEAESYNQINENYAEVLDENEEVIGYMAKGKGDGYGGPLTVGVAIDTTGIIQSLAVLEYRETPSFFHKVLKKGILKDLAQRSVNDSVPFTQLVDGITGATLTYRAITESVEEASNTVAQQGFNINKPDKKKDVLFGLPEIILILLFVIAVLRRKFVKGKNGQRLRWLTLISGFILLGFVYNRSFVMADINMVLLGYLPDWHNHLYWYILIIGLFLFKAKENWNTYCYDFCPFGAAQDILGEIGGAKNRPVQWPKLLLWSQRTLAITAVSMALLFRNPGFSSFEIFGTMFDLNGSSYQFVLFAIILLLSLFIHRPWCRYLCPLHKNTLEGLFDRVRNYAKLIFKLIFKKWMTN